MGVTGGRRGRGSSGASVLRLEENPFHRVDEAVRGAAEKVVAVYMEEKRPEDKRYPDAIEAAKSSKWLHDVIGEDCLTILIQQAEREVEFINTPISQVEIDRYMANF